MNKIIGKVLSDGSVKHITLYDEYNYYKHGDIAPILKNFYSRQERLDALLDLGNLYAFNPNPMDKFNNNINDTINCEAAIRDRKQSENKHCYLISQDKKKLAERSEPCYLFENGHWYIYRRGKWTYMDVITTANNKTDADFQKLHIYYIKPEKGLEKVYNHFPNWEHMAAHANMENKTYYIFRDNKLISTVKP